MIFLAFLLWSGMGGGPTAAVADTQIESPLIIRAVRFYRADLHHTGVKGLVQIPLAVISRPDDSTSAASYSVAVRVADSTGLTLYQQSWRNRLPRGAAGGSGYTVEIFDFAVANGQYRLEVATSYPLRPEAELDRADRRLVGFERGVGPAARAGDAPGGSDRHGAPSRGVPYR